jgi:hypothetical protein
VQPAPPWGYPAVDAILLHRRELGLSAQQVDALTKLRLDAGLRATDLNAQREQTCLRLDAALSEQKVDLEAVRNLLNAIAEAEAGMYYTGIEASVKAEQLLSADQLARLDQIVTAPAWQVLPPAPPALPGTGPRAPVAPRMPPGVPLQAPAPAVPVAPPGPTMPPGPPAPMP